MPSARYTRLKTQCRVRSSVSGAPDFCTSEPAAFKTSLIARRISSAPKVRPARSATRPARRGQSGWMSVPPASKTQARAPLSEGCSMVVTILCAAFETAAPVSIGVPRKLLHSPRDDPPRRAERSLSLLSRATRFRHDERDTKVSARALKRLARRPLVQSGFRAEDAERALAQLQ